MISLISPRSSKHILSIWYETFHVVKETRSFDFTVKQEHKDRLTWGLKGWAHFTSCHILCNRIRSKVLHTLYKLRSASHIQAPRDSPVFHPAEIHGFQFQFQNAMQYCLSLKAPHHKRAVSTFWKSICYMIPWSTAQQQQAPKIPPTAPQQRSTSCRILYHDHRKSNLCLLHTPLHSHNVFRIDSIRFDWIESETVQIPAIVISR